MTDKDEFGKRLASNLKALNAKERDHLMRFAYLGEGGAYEGSGEFLSQSFLKSLKAKMFGESSPLADKDVVCLFAGMDYHIDWLHAALFMAAKRMTIGCNHTDEPQCRGKKWGDDSENSEDLDLRPVLGNQEDVDLLVLLDVPGIEQGDPGKLHLVFIEAKGTDSFDPVQLGRKLVRVNRSIREASDATDLDLSHWLDFTYLLLSASDPRIVGYVEYITEKNGSRKKAPSAKEDPLAGIDRQLKGERDGLSFNPESKWLEMKNYPARLWRVQRCQRCDGDEEAKANANGAYWRLERRKARDSDESRGE